MTFTEEQTQAIGVAARCWCDEETKTITMDPILAGAFSKRVEGYLSLIDTAWGIIANASGGDWERENTEWQEAAKRWRERYHAMLSAHGDPN